MKETTLLTSPRDKGGSIASTRLDYQKDWSLCRMIEAHESADDYVFIFEHDEGLSDELVANKLISHIN